MCASGERGAAMVHVDRDLLGRLEARLDAQEAQLAELAALRAKVALLEGAGAASLSPAPPIEARVPRRSASSRRALLKGAGALVFTTPLLATGEVIPVAPYRVAAADPPPRPSGPAPKLATAPDTLYQTFVGTDFQPETTAN